MIAPMLHDGFSRKFAYLRLSVTDLCNFRCRYCLPEGHSGDREGELGLDEIGRLLRGAALAGFRKLRLTGGEPTVRQDLFSIVEEAKRAGSFQQIALSTNGWNLRKIARPLREAGVTRVNVSVDSLDAGRFSELTGKRALDPVLAGVEECLGLGFESVKLNSVLHADTAQAELGRFLEYVRTRPVTVRFIELMRTRNLPAYRERHFVSAGTLRLALLGRGWVQEERSAWDGPAVEFSHPDHAGRIGLIAPHSEGFCESCNRLRITSRGKLRLCLFGEEEFPLRGYLQDEDGVRQLPGVLSDLLAAKPPGHFLSEGRSGLIGAFSEVGG